jgi:L-seryl-tRNA(Ser) seleniumtransferase
MSVDELRGLPSVDRLVNQPELRQLASLHSQALVVEAARTVLQEARSRIQTGGALAGPGELEAEVARRVLLLLEPTLGGVINATGVLIHTNLGRAPLSNAARAALLEVGTGYCNLEIDLATGERGSRYVHATGLICQLTGAASALVVNNNAAAVMLAVGALATGREVVISRGQLVEIGGGFRVPEVMAASGARLVEVGTTNRTYQEDYARAITERTAALLVVHSSNFRTVGFTHDASLAEVADLAHSQGLPVIYDIGSGCLLDTRPFGMAYEPTVPTAVREGADLICFSGDKLLGGPQAGLIVGRADLIAALERLPMTRALRVDKATLAALQATLRSYARGKALEEIPVWQMITMPLPAIEARAAAWARALTQAGMRAEVLPGTSTVGGGSLPGEELPTCLAALCLPSPDLVAVRLRLGRPPVVARIEGDRLLLDPRTVSPDQDDALLDAVTRAAA